MIELFGCDWLCVAARVGELLFWSFLIAAGVLLTILLAPAVCILTLGAVVWTCSLCLFAIVVGVAAAIIGLPLWVLLWLWWF